MLFCPRCGSILVSKRDELVCPKCGYRRELDPTSAHYFKKSTQFTKVLEKRVDVEGVGAPSSAILDTSITCPKCGRKGVYYWRRHRSSAESSDVIEKVYKCSFCGYSWAETA